MSAVERALAALRRVEVRKGLSSGSGVQERQQRREGVLERLVEREHLPGDLGPDGARVIAVVDMAVALEQVDDGEVGRGLAVGHRGALQHPPALGAVGVDELVDQARLAHARLPHQRHHLAMPGLRLCQGLVQGLQLLLPPHKAREPPRGRRLQAPAQRTGPHQLKHLHGLGQPLDRHRPQGVDLHQALHQPQGGGRQAMLPGVASCSMRAARCVVCPTAE